VIIMLLIVLISFCLHFTLYYILKLLLPIFLENNYKKGKISKYDKDHLPQICISIFHAIISTQGSIRYLMKFPIDFGLYTKKMIPDVTSEPDDILVFYLAFSLGYFFYDLIIYLLLEIQKVRCIQIIHHIIAIACFTSGILTKVGTFGMICLTTNEISTPFLHVLSIMHSLQLQNEYPSFFKLVEISFVLVFLSNRILWNVFISSTALSAAIWRQYDFSLVNKIFLGVCMTMHVGIQFIWLFEIIKKIVNSQKVKKEI